MPYNLNHFPIKVATILANATRENAHTRPPVMRFIYTHPPPLVPLIAAISEGPLVRVTSIYRASICCLSCAVSPGSPPWQRFVTPLTPCAISVEDCKSTSQIKAQTDSPVTKSMQIHPVRASCAGAWTGADTALPPPPPPASIVSSLSLPLSECDTLYRGIQLLLAKALNKLLQLL